MFHKCFDWLVYKKIWHKGSVPDLNILSFIVLRLLKMLHETIVDYYVIFVDKSLPVGLSCHS